MIPRRRISINETVTKRIHQQIFRTILLTLFYIVCVNKLFAANILLDSYEVTPLNNAYRLRINFFEPITYLNHYPQSSGNQIKITVRSFLIGSSQTDALRITDYLQPEPDNNLGIVAMRMENDDSGKIILKLEFKSQISYKVLQDRSNKSVSVYINADSLNLPIKPAPSASVSKKSARPKSSSLQKYYVINLKTTSEKTDTNELSRQAPYNKYYLFDNQSESDNEIQYTLQLGFFRSWKNARNELVKVNQRFPDAWIDRVDATNINTAVNWLKQQDTGNKTDITSTPESEPVSEITTAPDQRPEIKSNVTKSTRTDLTESKPETAPEFQTQEQISQSESPETATIKPGSQSSAKVQSLLEQGRNAMIAKEYTKAYRYYNKAFKLANGLDKQFALEFAGLARERNGQTAHAKAEYRRYLELYPEGEGSDRVRQRLEALITARLAPKAALAQKDDKKDKDDVRWEMFGSLFQFYRYEISGTNQTENQAVDNSLSTNISLSARRRSADYDMKFRVDADNLYNSLDTRQKSTSRISRLYADITAKQSGNYLRAGRQSSNNSGMLGRFDGLILAHPFSNNYKLSLNMGYPVNLTESTVFQNDRYFYGMNLDATDLIKDWDFNFYAIKQVADGFSDREAIGTEIKVINTDYSLFGNFDYDTSYGELNTATLIANFLYGKNNAGSFNIVADYRLTPTLSTTNALIGQTVSTLTELHSTYTETEIRQFAVDRTAVYKTLSVANSYPFTETIQLNTDVTVSNLSGTPASAGVLATDSPGNEYYYSITFIGTNFITDSDVTLLGIRYANLSTADTITYDVSTRIRYGKDWRVRPRLRVDVQTQSNGTNRTIYRPSFRVDYYAKRNLKFELDTGYDYKSITTTTNNTTTTTVTDETNYYLSLGVIYDF